MNRLLSERRITNFLEALAGFVSSTAIDAGVPMLAELPGITRSPHLSVGATPGLSPLVYAGLTLAGLLSPCKPTGAIPNASSS